MRERKNKLSWPPCKGETRERSDDEREEAALLPTNESGQETKRTEEEALSAASACRGEARELTMSVLEEREGRENQQWRRGSNAASTIGRVWGGKASPVEEPASAGDDCRSPSGLPRERTASAVRTRTFSYGESVPGYPG